jgi:2-hydroxychromene-2-carboxylate isomerase
LAARYGRAVKWHPILLGIVFKTTGGAPVVAAPLKGTYGLRDIERTARFHDISYKHPSRFPLPTQFAARAMLWLQETQGEDKAHEFAQAVYRAYFVDDIDISAPANVTQIANAMGLDTIAMAEATGSEPLKERLKGNIETAMARGVFGSPFIVVDDEPFWGFDRFDQIEAYLKNGKI